MREKRLAWRLLVLSQGMLTRGMGIILFSGIMGPDGFNRWGILNLACGSVNFVTNLVALRKWHR